MYLTAILLIINSTLLGRHAKPPLIQSVQAIDKAVLLQKKSSFECSWKPISFEEVNKLIKQKQNEEMSLKYKKSQEKNHKISFERQVQ